MGLILYEIEHGEDDTDGGKCCTKVPIETICANLLKCLMLFYGVFYIAAGICHGAFRLGTLQAFDPRIPFDFHEPFSWQSSRYLARLVSMESTYFVCTWAFAAIVQHCVWDYAITITLVHVSISCAVMQGFPLTWQWWVTLGCGVFFMIIVGEMVLCCVRCKGQRTKVTPNPRRSGVT
ncbi:putative transmembrane protein 244 [Branchiostoma lanceolatum]|uniref:putative transmembrane protein 244 n=1 Tax=Branchiostoma lanceolatum TaxID=7740 RepID=UPI00345263A6